MLRKRDLRSWQKSNKNWRLKEEIPVVKEAIDCNATFETQEWDVKKCFKVLKRLSGWSLWFWLLIGIILWFVYYGYHESGAPKRPFENEKNDDARSWN